MLYQLYYTRYTEGIQVRLAVGWYRRCRTRQSLGELDNQGTVFLIFYSVFFLAVAMTGGRVTSFLGGDERYLRTREMIVSRSVYMLEHLRGSYKVLWYTHCCPWKWPHKKTLQLIRRCHPCARKFASKAVLSRMQLTLQATRTTRHGGSRLVQAMSA